MNRLYPALTAALVILLVATTCASRRALGDRDAALAKARTDLMAIRADSAGWETRLVEATTDLEAKLQEAVDSTDVLSVALAGLARENELLGGELRAVATMYAGLAGSIEAHDATVHRTQTSPTEDSRESPVDSVTAPIDDGLLSGRLVYRPPSTLAIDPYRVELALALGWTETPDGRALVTARASDPRVALSFGDVYWSPPPRVERCSLWCQLKVGARGYFIGRGAELALGELVP